MKYRQVHHALISKKSFLAELPRNRPLTGRKKGRKGIRPIPVATGARHFAHVTCCHDLRTIDSRLHKTLMNLAMMPRALAKAPFQIGSNCKFSSLVWTVFNMQRPDFCLSVRVDGDRPDTLDTGYLLKKNVCIRFRGSPYRSVLLLCMENNL